MKRIDLTPDEEYWLQYAVSRTIANLPPDDTQARAALQRLLIKLEQPAISENLVQSLQPPRIHVLDSSQGGRYQVGGDRP